MTPAPEILGNFKNCLTGEDAYCFYYLPSNSAINQSSKKWSIWQALNRTFPTKFLAEGRSSFKGWPSGQRRPNGPYYLETA
jgi:hypothetical protein